MITPDDPTIQETKRYLGDGVYAAYDGFAIVLTAEDGIRATDTIVLEPDVLAALLAYASNVRR